MIVFIKISRLSLWRYQKHVLRKAKWPKKPSSFYPLSTAAFCPPNLALAWRKPSEGGAVGFGALIAANQKPLSSGKFCVSCASYLGWHMRLQCYSTDHVASWMPKVLALYCSALGLKCAPVLTGLLESTASQNIYQKLPLLFGTPPKN